MFLKNHSISVEFRAKMVDWMAEVLHTFKCSCQTFFLAVNIMDRYFKMVQRNLETQDLHLSGIVAMFIASKYEDVIPLMMRTVVNKIGHGKFTGEMISQKEFEMLKVLGFKIGAPTVKEKLDRLFEEVSNVFLFEENDKELCYYIAKLACHDYKLMQLPTSKLAVTVLRIALKVIDQ